MTTIKIVYVGLIATNHKQVGKRVHLTHKQHSRYLFSCFFFKFPYLILEVQSFNQMNHCIFTYWKNESHGTHCDLLLSDQSSNTTKNSISILLTITLSLPPKILLSFAQILQLVPAQIVYPDPISLHGQANDTYLQRSTLFLFFCCFSSFISITNWYNWQIYPIQNTISLFLFYLKCCY